MRKRQTRARLRGERSQIAARLIQAMRMTDELACHRVDHLLREMERVNDRLRGRAS